jgi:SNF2 family DNA or RNA helicase
LFLKTNDTADLHENTRSNKLIRLLEMIQELRSEGDSCLIFTQYVEMGNILQAYLSQQLEEPVQFLHGGLPKAKRDAMITQFQDSAIPKEKQFSIFILSLKAGGIGLNLTAANHVFHFDRWWNPAVENQATDRAYRIGQTQDVQVHKFITLGTIEERIDEMIEKKQNLNDQIVSGSESWITEMSTTDLKELFSLRREWMAN